MRTNLLDILRKKGSTVVSARGSSTVFECIQIMVNANVGSIMVIEDGAVKGIFTERDYLRRIILQGRTSKETRVSEVMTTDLVCVDPTYTVQECLSIMTQKKIRHLPVIEKEGVVGVVSIGDCVKQIADDAQTRVRYLEEFVTGQYPG